MRFVVSRVQKSGPGVYYDLKRNEDSMATKVANFFDFFKGFLYGVWIGITTNPFKSNAILIEEIMQKRRERIF
jgi:hypothetical protein